ncbi:winged helix-turn-helix transcriptional regulator [Glutamicibacter sp. NPDC090743]|uniref:winged helix-turn-helix transcriptional regulator n=1 Tax=Glutamicibacter sp. NPDC090743 TaxID=3364001 RepID=UPI00381EEF22
MSPIPQGSQKSLTSTLRRLERNGAIGHHVISSRPIAIQYRITAPGKPMRDPIDAILQWAVDNMEQITQARETFDDMETLPQ